MTDRQQIQLQLGCAEPHEKQRAFLALQTQETDGIAIAHGVAGRGGGKTIAGILWILESALTYNAGLPHCWTAPTYRVLSDVLLPTWQRIVPRELYEYRASDRRIVICNGAYIDCRSRSDPDKGRGMSYTGVLHDELAMDESRAAYDVWYSTVRRLPNSKGGKLWYVGISTPRPGWYQMEVLERGYPWVHWTSYDNPYDSHERLAQIERDYSPEFARQEIYAEFVPQSGLIWRHFRETAWPDGNLHTHAWTKGPYTLACDLGIRSAWLVIQNVQGVDVVVAEYTPNDEGAQQTLGRIDREYGRPSLVVCGSDINTRTIGDASRPVMFFRQRWGSIPIRVPLGDLGDKQWQHDVLSGRIYNTRGERRFCVSEQLRSHDAGNKRGILAMMRYDKWPERAPKIGEFLPKDKTSGGMGLEDVRDAALYYAICKYPPHFVQQPTLAA